MLLLWLIQLSCYQVVNYILGNGCIGISGELNDRENSKEIPDLWSQSYLCKVCNGSTTAVN